MKVIASIAMFLYHLQTMKQKLWIKLVTDLAFCIDKHLPEGRMRCKMSNYTLLKTPYWNILNREFKTRVELSQIRQTLYDFSLSFVRVRVSVKGTFKQARKCAPRGLPTLNRTLHRPLNRPSYSDTLNRPASIESEEAPTESKIQYLGGT